MRYAQRKVKWKYFGPALLYIEPKDSRLNIKQSRSEVLYFRKGGKIWASSMFSWTNDQWKLSDCCKWYSKLTPRCPNFRNTKPIGLIVTYFGESDTWCCRSCHCKVLPVCHHLLLPKVWLISQIPQTSCCSSMKCRRCFGRHIFLSPHSLQHLQSRFISVIYNSVIQENVNILCSEKH